MIAVAIVTMTFPSGFLATVPIGSFGSASATVRHRDGLDLPTMSLSAQRRRVASAKSVS